MGWRAHGDNLRYRFVSAIIAPHKHIHDSQTEIVARASIEFGASACQNEPGWVLAWLAILQGEVWGGLLPHVDSAVASGGSRER